MNIQELLSLKEELINIYNHEKDNSPKEVLDDIKKEITKVDRLIMIYQSDNKQYIVMQLESLYLFLLSNKESSELEDTELFNLFDLYFPSKWVYINDLELKEHLLLEAICNNEIIKEPKVLNKENHGEWQ